MNTTLLFPFVCFVSFVFRRFCQTRENYFLGGSYGKT